MRVADEKRTVEQMIRLYCRHKEGNAELCDSCRHLLEYAAARLERCPHGDAKPTCRKCTVHCYRPAEREKIRLIMRYSGPRMMIYHPAAALRHLWRETTDNKRTKQ